VDTRTYRIGFGEPYLPDLGLDDEGAEPFLGGNAARVFNL
jgi:hypothetical protein